MSAFADSVKSFGDRLANFVSGLGTARDKNTHNRYAMTHLSPEQLVTAYSTNWMAGKIVDLPAEDSTSKWRRWQAEREQITLIEAVEKAHGVQKKVKQAMIKARLLGGAAIVIGVDGAGDWSEPLDPTRVKKGALKYLHVVDRSEISASQIDRDLQSPYYGCPSMYQVGGVQIHPSRVVRLIGVEYPLKALEVDGWGMSVLQRCDDTIKDATIAAQGTATMINEATIDIVRIPEFMANMGNKDYSTKLTERFQLAATAKSIVRTLILDKEEEWSRQTNTFSGLPDLIDKYMGIVAGAADIPAVRMLGESPGGLNSTGESDLANYYDSIRSEQENELSPAMSMLDEVIIRSALGDRPEGIYYEWRPLWQPSDAQKADTMLKRTQAITNIYNTGYVPDEPMSKAVQNMLVEDGSLPGLDTALSEYDDSDLDESDENVRDQFTRA